MSRLCQTICHDSQTSTDFRINKRVDRSTFIRKDISGWDCEGDWGFVTVVAILCVYQKLGAIKIEVEVKSKKKGQLTIQCDEMWSFVGNKDNKQWIWLAIDASTKEMAGVYIGKRDQAGAQGLWDSLPPVYRQCAVSYTDFWSAYGTVFPQKRYKAVGKETGLTNYIERFNNTMKQRISRLVRKTLSFSKKLSNYIWAIWYFIHEYNASLSIN